MKLLRSTLALAVVTVVPMRAVQSPVQADDAAIRATLNRYLDGHATGDGAHMRAAFHTKAKLQWIRDDALAERPATEYAAGFSGRPAADEAQRRRRIVSVDRTGNVAVAKVELDYPQTRFTDYMSLAKVGAEWKIVNKLYVSEPKGTAGR